ncbi:hypothetical protein IOLA_111 [uncultured bacterium]|nr:hypothetical protein IOLA_111 [uncultured bacterium]
MINIDHNNNSIYNRLLKIKHDIYKIKLFNDMNNIFIFLLIIIMIIFTMKILIDIICIIQ